MIIMKRILSWIVMLITIIVSGNTTELQRDGWNLISVCQDMNASDINLTNIEEIQSQNGGTIYTGQYSKYSNLKILYAGYGYWIKGKIGTNFNSGASKNYLAKPLIRDGWNLMASCENTSKSEIELNGITEIQSQDGQTLYTGNFEKFSNLEILKGGYGYWVYGDSGLLFTAKQSGSNGEALTNFSLVKKNYIII